MKWSECESSDLISALKFRKSDDICTPPHSVGRDSSVGMATRYGLNGSGIESYWRERLSAPLQTGPGDYPASCTVVTGLFPGVKRPGRGVEHLYPPTAEVKERVELHLYYPSVPSWRLTDGTLLYHYTNCVYVRHFTLPDDGFPRRSKYVLLNHSATLQI
jgi:hypothetical protein